MNDIRQTNSFGAERYKPVTVQIGQLEAFFRLTDEDGLSNAEKVRRSQHVIRRVATTAKDRSFEDAEPAAAGSGLPPGLVLRDGKLVGFGIDILNEDIYPLQSFEIYLRSCGLSGKLDLSGCADLLFVDVYHNRLSAVDLRGAGALWILGIQDNLIESLDLRDLAACRGIDAGRNRLREIDVSRCGELVELYVNDNRLSEVDLSRCPKLKYFYCHNNGIAGLDTTANPLLRHLNATGNPMKRIRSLAPQRAERLPLALTAEGPGTVGLRFNPVYNAQWKETGEWQQTYYAYPDEGHVFTGWYDAAGQLLSREAEWQDAYGADRVLTARFGDR